MAHFIPCSKRTDALRTAVVKLHGLPIVSDRDVQFVSDFSGI